MAQLHGLLSVLPRLSMNAFCFFLSDLLFPFRRLIPSLTTLFGKFDERRATFALVL